MKEIREYSEKFKETMVKKSFLAKDLNTNHFCREYGIPSSTFRGWRDKYNIEHRDDLMENKDIIDLTDKEKLQLLLESKTKSNDDLGFFLREKGVTEDQLGLWEKELFNIIDTTESGHKLSKANKKINELEKDLRKKEKALAEASALLVLKKKADLIWGKEEE